MRTRKRIVSLRRISSRSVGEGRDAAPSISSSWPIGRVEKGHPVGLLPLSSPLHAAATEWVEAAAGQATVEAWMRGRSKRRRRWRWQRPRRRGRAGGPEMNGGGVAAAVAVPPARMLKRGIDHGVPLLLPSHRAPPGIDLPCRHRHGARRRYPWKLELRRHHGAERAVMRDREFGHHVHEVLYSGIGFLKSSLLFLASPRFPAPLGPPRVATSPRSCLFLARPVSAVRVSHSPTSGFAKKHLNLSQIQLGPIRQTLTALSLPTAAPPLLTAAVAPRLLHR